MRQFLTETAVRAAPFVLPTLCTGSQPSQRTCLPAKIWLR